MIIKTRTRFKREESKPCLGMGKVSKVNKKATEINPSNVATQQTTDVQAIRLAWKKETIDPRKEWESLWK